MWLGTHDHWTTWLTVLVNAGEEFTLLGTCLVFKCLAARRQREAMIEERGKRVMMAALAPNSAQFGSRDELSYDGMKHDDRGLI
jgi:hypothetical protein